MKRYISILILVGILSLPMWSAESAEATAPRRGALYPSFVNEVIPHITHGSYWRSSLIIMNVSKEPAFYRIQFFKPNGEDANFRTDSLGNIHEAYGVLQPGGSTTIRSIEDHSPTETLYWAEIVEGSGKIQVTTVFTLNYPGIQPVEFTVPNVDYLTDAIYFPFDNTNGYGTAIALANASTYSDEKYRLEARDEAGTIIFSGVINLPKRNNMTAVLSKLFPQLENKKGTIIIKSDSSSASSYIYCAPLVLRFNAGWSLTYIPAYDEY